MIELRHLQYFRALAETLHFGRAAERLHISQPPLSRQIALLEQELGVKLFDRSRRHVELTDAGQRFYLDTGTVFAAFEQAKRNALAAARGAAGELSVGFMMSTAYSVTPAITRRYAAQYPQVNLKLTETLPMDLAQDISSGSKDVAIMYRPQDCSGLETVTIYREEMTVVLPPGHRLLEQPLIDPRDLAAETFIIVPRRIAPALHDMIVNYCLQHGVTPNVGLEINMQQTIVNLVGEGLGIERQGADALTAAELPVAEVHLSNIHKREAFRHHSYVSAVAETVIAGAGPIGYELAVRYLADRLSR